MDALMKALRAGTPILVEALRSGRELSAELFRSITTSTGLSIESVQRLLNDMTLPAYIWFTPRVFHNLNAEGSAISWKTKTGRDTNSTLPYVPEGKRAGTVQLATGEGSGTWGTVGIEDSYTDEGMHEGAYLLGGGIETAVRDLCVANLGECFSEKLEYALAFSNKDVPLGTPAAPAGVASGGGALEADDYWAVVVALTMDGWQLASLESGLVKSQVVTTGAGESYTLNAGLSARGTTSGGVSVTAGQQVSWTVDAIDGAVAYAWFVGRNTGAAPADAGLRLQAITTVNALELSTLRTDTQTLADLALGAADYSVEPLALGGLYYRAMKLGMASQISLDDTPLTMTNQVVDQLDQLLFEMWREQRLGPEALVLSAQTRRAIERLAFDASANSRTMFVITDEVRRDGLTLGGRVVAVENPYTGEVVPLVTVPWMPDGMIFAPRLTRNVPGTPSNRTVELRSFGGAWRVDWMPVTRAQWHGMYLHGGVIVYMPTAFGVITNIRVSQ